MRKGKYAQVRFGDNSDYGNDEEMLEHWIDVIVKKVSSLKTIVRIVSHFLRLEGRDRTRLNPDINIDPDSKFKVVSAEKYGDAVKVILEHEQNELDSSSLHHKKVINIIYLFVT